MIKHTVTLSKLTNGTEITYKLGKVVISEADYLSTLRQAKTTKVESNEPLRIKNRVVGTTLVISATGVPQESVEVFNTAPEQDEPVVQEKASDYEAQSIAQSGE